MSKIYVRENKLLVMEMIKIYKPGDIDWMSYLITKNNPLTFHHIKKENMIEYGALLTKKAHRALNILATKDPDLFHEWNLLFQEINKSNSPMDKYEIDYSYLLKEETKRVLYK